MLVVFVSALFYGCCVCISSLSAGGVCSITQQSPSQGGERGERGRKQALGEGFICRVAKLKENGKPKRKQRRKFLKGLFTKFVSIAQISYFGQYG